MADIQNDPAFRQVLGELAHRCAEGGYEPMPLTRAELDQILVDNGLVTAPLGTPDAARQRSRILGALHIASLREEEGRLPFRLVMVDRTLGMYRVMPKPDWARERPTQHFAEVRRHHERHKKEMETLLKSDLIADETKALMLVYVASLDNSIELVKQTEATIMMAFHHGYEALEALGRQFAAEAAQRRIGNQFSPLRALPRNSDAAD